MISFLTLIVSLVILFITGKDEVVSFWNKIKEGVKKWRI